MGRYSNILGAPGTGVHSIRICNIAVVDLTLTVFVAWLVARIFGLHFWCVFLFLFLLGILLHRAFDVRTTIDRMLF